VICNPWCVHDDSSSSKPTLRINLNEHPIFYPTSLQIKHFFINCARNILFKNIIYTTFLVINYFADYYLLSISFSLQLKQITDQLFKSNFTFSVICVFTLQTDEWCVHNRLFNANFENEHPIRYIFVQIFIASNSPIALLLQWE
jgi:hypothetical protein